MAVESFTDGFWASLGPGAPNSAYSTAMFAASQFPAGVPGNEFRAAEFTMRASPRPRARSCPRRHPSCQGQ
jgi:hypothetical protein